MRVLVTGGAGFIGKSLIAELLNDYDVSSAVRRKKDTVDSQVRAICVNDIDGDTDWGCALKDCSAVIHLAASAHAQKNEKNSHSTQLQRVNVEATIALAEQAVASGVVQFVFLSSIGVHGQTTGRGEKIDENTSYSPYSPYTESKLEAEVELKKVFENTGIKLTIIRAPLVYGGQAQGSFNGLLKLIHAQVPLPFLFGSNERSLISLESVVDFIVLCVDNSSSYNQSFVISDDSTVSTKQIIRYISMGMKKRCFLFFAPNFIMKLVLFLIGKNTIYKQLWGSLVIDSTKAKSLMGWAPEKSTKNGLMQAGEDFEI